MFFINFLVLPQIIFIKRYCSSETFNISFSARDPSINTLEYNTDISTVVYATQRDSESTYYTDANHNLDKCLDADECKNVKNSQKWFCYCDKDCLLYNDCCHGYRPKDVYSRSQFSCFSFTKAKPSIGMAGFMAIDKCPTAYKNESTLNRCREENLADDGSFVVWNQSVVFKNRFCAYCHGVFEFEHFKVIFYEIYLENADLDVFLNLSLIEKLKHLEENAEHRIEPPENTNVRYCAPELFSDYTAKCSSYVNPVFSSVTNLIYRNGHCTGHGDISELELSCLKDINWIVPARVSIFSMSVMFSFSNEDDMPCNNPRCEVLYGRCQQTELYSNFTDEIEIYWQAETNVSEDILQKVGYLTPWIFSVFNSYVQDYTIFIEPEPAFKNVRVFMNIHYKTIDYLTSQDVSRLIHPNYLPDVNFKVDRPDNVETKFKLTTKLPLNFVNSTRIPLGNVFTFGDSQVGFDYQAMVYSFSLLNISVIHFEKLIFCKSILLSLNYLPHSLNVTSVKCQTAADDVIPKLLTYVSFSVSVFSLLVLIGIQRKLGLITNPPSSNIENIAFALLGSNLLFMVGIGFSKIQAICYLVGVLLHYLWLSVFTFMTISVGYISNTLLQIKDNHLVNTTTSRRKRLMLTLVGLIVPVVFVLPTVLIDIYSPLKAGYGQGACFPDKYPLNLIFFTGPVLVSVSTNTLLLIYNVASVCRLHIQTSMVRHSDPIKDALVYLRVAALSGLPWFIIVLAEFYHYKWLEYTFIILCGLQGFFVALATLSSVRVRNAMFDASGSNTHAIQHSVSQTTHM